MTDLQPVCTRDGRVSALQPVQRRSAQHDASTVVGLLNARSVGSLSKQLAVHDRIVSDRLHLCAVVETWHDAADNPQLIACTPSGYSYIEKVHPRSVSAELSMRTNHGGLCLFYASFLSAREVPLAVYKSGVEVLAVYCRGAGHKMLAVVIYRPPVVSISTFFDDLADVLGCPRLHALSS